MANEQRAILAAWDKAVKEFRTGYRYTSYTDAAKQFYYAVELSGLSVELYYAPLMVASGH